MHCLRNALSCISRTVHFRWHALAAVDDRRKTSSSGFRIIQRPCRAKAGARICVSLDHQAQTELRDDIRILRCIVDGDSITKMRRALVEPDTGKQIGVSRLYLRIVWLEKTLLAFEREVEGVDEARGCVRPVWPDADRA
jgi:hypothetical protein